MSEGVGCWGKYGQGCFLIPLKLDLWGGGEAREVGFRGRIFINKKLFFMFKKTLSPPPHHPIPPGNF
jgi:hypothetical protein